MPDVATMETNDLYAEVYNWMAANPLTQYQSEVIEELSGRIVKENDPDDIQTNGQNTLRNGIRPYRTPRV